MVAVFLNDVPCTVIFAQCELNDADFRQASGCRCASLVFIYTLLGRFLHNSSLYHSLFSLNDVKRTRAFAQLKLTADDIRRASVRSCRVTYAQSFP